MDSKYGTIENATKVFKGMPQSDLVSWTFLTVRNAQNGQPNEAI